MVRIEHCHQNGCYAIDTEKDGRVGSFKLSGVEYTKFLMERVNTYGYRVETTENGVMVLCLPGDTYYYIIHND